MIGLGVGAVVICWLVFSVLKKVLSFVFIGAVILGGLLLWNNPAAMQAVTGAIMKMFGPS